MEIIKTKLSHCKDCYKCVRRCEVKAIQIKDGHAQVIPERCILDGRCVLICPQSAKEVYSGLDKVKELINSKRKVVVSLAPSFVASFPDVPPRKLVTALKTLGFDEVEETSVAAFYVASEYKKLLETHSFLISTDCPSLVNLVEKYYPQYKHYLAPVVSPMTAHGRMLKSAWQRNYQENVAVVFVGPCIAKIDEAFNGGFADGVDAALSFAELKRWMMDRQLDLQAMAEAEWAPSEAGMDSRLYPVEGGFLKSAGFSGEISSNLKTITGFEECREFFAEMPDHPGNLRLVEMMICNEGCINGPLLDSSLPVITRRDLIFEYARSRDTLPLLFDYSRESFDLSREFRDRRFPAPEPSEDDLKILMAKIGKYTRQDELDCGACGYYTCREKARAVFQGMAELEMCLPYMRKKAESRANKIIEQDPNGVILMGEEYRIVQFNHAFRRIYNLPTEINPIGKRIEEVIGSNCFLNVARSLEPTSFVFTHAGIGKTIEVISFQLEDEDMLVGIFVDITQRIRNSERLLKIKKEAIEKTEDVIHKQMRVSQEIASLMGETTAETKVSLLKLLGILREESEINE
ncbi:MAG: 4Fe-4S binding protein [Candidatus Delongbacteria bacterium]|nr:4Fe-4S binding protein [Candidatus Delongbacteria bacterium]